MSPIISNFADSGGLAFKGVDLRPQTCWDCGFESPRGHGSVSPVIVVWNQLEVFAMGRFLVKRSPTECGASECDRETSKMGKPKLWRGLSNPAKKYQILWQSVQLGPDRRVEVSRHLHRFAKSPGEGTSTFFTHRVICVFGTILAQIGSILRRAKKCFVFVMGIWCGFCEHEPHF